MPDVFDHFEKALAQINGNPGDARSFDKLDELLNLDEQRRKLLAEVESLKAERKRASKEIGALMGQKKLAEAEAKKKVGFFLGVARVLAQKPTARPKTEEPLGRLKPRVAAKDKWKRIEALGRMEGFQRAYREALAQLRAGARGVRFPHGTYLLRVNLGVACAA